MNINRENPALKPDGTYTDDFVNYMLQHQKIASEKNSCTADELRLIALKQKYEVEKAQNFKEALNRITSNKPKVICFLGSLYFIGSVLKEN